MKYALITDNSVQWFSYLVKITDDGRLYEKILIPNNLNNDFMGNLCKRGLCFVNFKFTNDVLPSEMTGTWYGNFISEYEFNRVKKMLDLYPMVKEFERLGKLE